MLRCSKLTDRSPAVRLKDALVDLHHYLRLIEDEYDHELAEAAASAMLDAWLEYRHRAGKLARQQPPAVAPIVP
jgi:hypothetical protein